MAGVAILLLTGRTVANFSIVFTGNDANADGRGMGQPPPGLVHRRFIRDTERP